MELCFVQHRLFLIQWSFSTHLPPPKDEYTKHTQTRRHNLHTPRSTKRNQEQTLVSGKRFTWTGSQCIGFFRHRSQSLQAGGVQPQQMQFPRGQSFTRISVESQSEKSQSKPSRTHRNRFGVVQHGWHQASSGNHSENASTVTAAEQGRHRCCSLKWPDNPNVNKGLVDNLGTSKTEQTKSTADTREGNRLNSGVRSTSWGVKMLDEELVQLLQHGQKEAFTKLVSKWQHPMYTFCYRQLGETALAEEATQDIFIKVYTSIHGFRSESKFSTWLYRIATNHCINLNERHHRRHRNQHDSFEDMHNQPSTKDTPLQDLEQKDFKHRLQQALNQLPEEHRVLLILRDLQDCSYDEIAEITQLNIGTIKSRIHRGRNNLRQILSGEQR